MRSIVNSRADKLGHFYYPWINLLFERILENKWSTSSVVDCHWQDFVLLDKLGLSFPNVVNGLLRRKLQVYCLNEL